MIRWSDIYERQQYYGDIARAMDEERFARQVLAAHSGRESTYHRLRFWLGRRLVAWGTNLQRRYSADLGPLTLSGGRPRQSSAG